jgi:hypothetical protein
MGATHGGMEQTRKPSPSDLDIGRLLYHRPGSSVAEGEDETERSRFAPPPAYYLHD